MTRKLRQPPAESRGPDGAGTTRTWLLQDAKARFSELVRRVHREGPQRVTVRGRDEVVVISADDFRRLEGDLKGLNLIAAMQAMPFPDTEIEPRRLEMQVRDIDL